MHGTTVAKKDLIGDAVVTIEVVEVVTQTIRIGNISPGRP